LLQSYDLLYEWLFEIRSKIFLSEYAIVWATFLAIQIVGMDAGIIIGVLVSVVDHVVHSAKMTGVNRVYKRSRAVWTPQQHKILQEYGYHLEDPKIVTLGTLSNS
jgi:MFS superfamily sulfate permease-like transporter